MAAARPAHKVYSCPAMQAVPHPLLVPLAHLPPVYELHRVIAFGHNGPPTAQTQ
jgi:hypothetical protein